MRTLFVIALVLPLSACGKKSEKSSDKPETETQPSTPELDERINRQIVDCDNGDCGDKATGGIAKIVIKDRQQLKFCTGFLVNAKTVATASSCLPEGLRLASASGRCESDVHIFFAPQGTMRQTRSVCESILLASPIPGKDPSLWPKDIAYIYLKEPASRRVIFNNLRRSGATENTELTMWRVDADNDEVGIIRKDTCKVVHKSYVNPLASSPYSPGLIISGCEYHRGNGGALLMDSDRWVWGLVSQGVDRGLTDYLTSTGLLTAPLKPLLHAANGTCMPSLLDGNPVENMECFKTLDYATLDAARAKMLLLGEEKPKEIKAKLEAQGGYFKWDVKLERVSETSSQYKVVAKPTCMNPVSGWINAVGANRTRFDYTVPNIDSRIELAFDSSSRGTGRVVKTKSFGVEFEPKRARTEGQTKTWTWMGTWNGENNTEDYRANPSIGVCN